VNLPELTCIGVVVGVVEQRQGRDTL
jgi:hypothetical protein